MSERLTNSEFNSSPFHFICEAAGQAGDAAWEMIPVGDGLGVEVCLTVNGVELPFKKTVQALYDEIETLVNNKAAVLAFETAKLNGLDQLKEAVERADWEIRTKVEEAFGVTLSRKDY